MRLAFVAPIALAALAAVAAIAALAGVAAVAHARPPRWQTLPLPPAMPAPATKGHVEVDGVQMYYATFGTGTPVILLHGGMGNGEHWAHQVSAFAATMQVIVIDSRGQGRSTRTKAAPSYDAMAGDVLAVMDHLGVERAAIVGWSDGGEIALKLGIHHPARVTKLVIFGAHYDASGTKPRKAAATFKRYNTRCRADYARLSPTPKQYDATVRWLAPIWRTPMGFTKEQLASIRTPTLVAVGEHDEIVQRAHVEEMARLIPNARLEVFADTSHFTHWQDPASFNKVLVDFLAPAPAK